MSCATTRLRCIANHCRNTNPKMTQKSFSKGSPFPPLKPGLLRLYSMRFCPWAERTRLILAHKNIPHETINIDLKNKPDWFWQKNPLGLVPVLELDDKIVYESSATCEWLDDIYAENPLQSNDPYRKAWDRILLEYFGKLSSAIYGVRNPEQKEKHLETLKKAYQFYEDALTQRGGPFLGGSSPAMIDFFIWPHMERVLVLATTEPSVAVNKDSFPKLAEWLEAMCATPAVKATMFDVQTHLKFHESVKNGKPDYDIGLEE